jgi:hypothetical protein
LLFAANPELGGRRCSLDAYGEPDFLAFVLTAYQDRHRLDDAGLAALLWCDVATPTHVRLCRRPGAVEPQRTAEDVDVIAKRYGVDAAALARIVAESHGREDS